MTLTGATQVLSTKPCCVLNDDATLVVRHTVGGFRFVQRTTYGNNHPCRICRHRYGSHSPYVLATISA